MTSSTGSPPAHGSAESESEHPTLEGADNNGNGRIRPAGQGSLPDHRKSRHGGEKPLPGGHRLRPLGAPGRNFESKRRGRKSRSGKRAHRRLHRPSDPDGRPDRRHLRRGEKAHPAGRPGRGRGGRLFAPQRPADRKSPGARGHGGYHL